MASVFRTLALLATLVPLPLLAIDLYNNTNTGGVQNNPAHRPEFITPMTVHVTQVQTYHWNNGRGAAPGTITIKSMNGQSFGPFRVKGSSGQNNAPNVNWVADVNLTLPIGTYEVIDSDPNTWSHNAQSHNVGFAIIRGERSVPGATPTPPSNTASNTHPVVPTVPGSGKQPTPPKPPTTTPVNTKPNPKPPTPSPTAAFQPCSTNAGSIAQMGPCKGAPGTKISIRLSRKLNSPLKEIVFKPYQVTGIPGATGAQVISAVQGNATASGSIYDVVAPQQLCIGGGGTWDLFPVDAAGQGQGDIGRFMVDCRPGAVATNTGPNATTTPPPPPPTPAAFKPCFVNSGSIASSSPCTGRPGDTVTIRLSRQLKSPLRQVVFKPYQVTGIPGGTGAQVIAQLNGSGLASGSDYTTPAPQQLCLAGNGSWDLWPIDAKGTGQGDIGRINVICR